MMLVITKRDIALGVVLAILLAIGILLAKDDHSAKVITWIIGALFIAHIMGNVGAEVFIRREEKRKTRTVHMTAVKEKPKVESVDTTELGLGCSSEDK